MLEPDVADMQNALGSGSIFGSGGTVHDCSFVPGGSPERSSLNVIGLTSEFLVSDVLNHPEVPISTFTTML